MHVTYNANMCDFQACPYARSLHYLIVIGWTTKMNELDYSFSDGYKSALTAHSNELRKLAEKLAYMYLSDSIARMKFLNETNQLILANELEVKNYCISLSAGMDNITKARNDLELQYEYLRTNKVMQYAIIETRREEKYGYNGTIFLKQVGFVGGALQTYAGYGACYGSLGLLCGSLGFGLIAQGTNNMYENGYYIIFRENSSGYLRDGYRYASKSMGYSNYEADMAYSFVDLTLSGWTLANPALKPGAWKLFDYMDDSLVASWKVMGKVGLFTEMGLDGVTMYTLYDLNEQNKAKK